MKKDTKEKGEEMKQPTAWEELGLSNDFLFGKVMQDAELCQEFLQRVLPELEISHIEYPELQKGIRPDKDAKSIRLDVYVKDEKGTVYEIEMQVSDTKELPKRSRYYQGMIDLQLIDQGESYKKLKPSYIIFICPFDLFQRGRRRYSFLYLCKEERDLALEDGTVKIFLNTRSRMEDVSKELRAVLDYMDGEEAGEDAYVRKLEEAVKEAKKNREWRHEYMTLQMRDQENLERGIEQGIKQGIEQGRKQGIEQGQRQGIQQGILAMIAALKDLGIADEIILEKIKEKFDLSEESARNYIK